MELCPARSLRASRPQRGFSLNEALIALTLLTLGLLSIARFQSDVHEHAGETRAQTHAINLTEEKVEELRHQAAADYDSVADGNDGPAPLAGIGVDFTRRWEVRRLADPDRMRIGVATTWTSRDGVDHSVDIEAVLTATPPFAVTTRPPPQPAPSPEEANESADGAPDEVDGAAQEAPDASDGSEPLRMEADAAAACLCNWSRDTGRVVSDRRSRDPRCSDACCDAHRPGPDADPCPRASCDFVAQCAGMH